MEKLCCIFGAGEYYGTEIVPGNRFLTVSADGGYLAAKRLGITPDVHIGDFDSLAADVTAGEVIRLKPEKDDTDTLAAVKLAMERGCDGFILYGCTGGRTAHTVANIQTLASIAERGMAAWLAGNGEIYTCVHNGGVVFDEKSRGYVSVFSLSDKSIGVTERGLKYALHNDVLTRDFPIGTSNEFTGGEAEISVKNGTLLIIYTNKAAERSRK